MNGHVPRFHEEDVQRFFPLAERATNMLDLLWDDDKENLPPHALRASDRPPRYVRDPGSPELGTGRVGFLSRLEELRIHDEGPPDSLPPFRESQPHYYQSYERRFLNAEGQDPFPLPTRTFRRQQPQSDDGWEIWEDERDRVRHYYDYSSETQSDNGDGGDEGEGEAVEREASVSETASTSSSFENGTVPESRMADDIDASTDLGFHAWTPAERQPDISISEGVPRGPLPNARMRRRRGSRTLREQARLESLLRHEIRPAP